MSIPVARGLGDERVGHLGRVRRVADRVAPAEQHLRADVRHRRAQRGEPLPRVLGEEAQRDVVGRAAPALQGQQLRGQPGDVRRDGDQVPGAHPRRQQRLVGVPERRVGDRDRVLRAQPARRSPPGPSSASSWRDPAAAGASQDPAGQLVDRLADLRPPAVRPVHRGLGEVGEQPGAAVGRAAGGEQLGRSSMKHVVSRPAWKSGSASTAARNGMFVATPRMRNSATAPGGPGAPPCRRSWPRQVSLTSSESKCALTSAPVWWCRRRAGPPARPASGSG